MVKGVPGREGPAAPLTSKTSSAQWHPVAWHCRVPAVPRDHAAVPSGGGPGQQLCGRPGLGGHPLPLGEGAALASSWPLTLLQRVWRLIPVTPAPLPPGHGEGLRHRLLLQLHPRRLHGGQGVVQRLPLPGGRPRHAFLTILPWPVASIRDSIASVAAPWLRAASGRLRVHRRPALRRLHLRRAGQPSSAAAARRPRRRPPPSATGAATVNQQQPGLHPLLLLS